VKAELAVVNGTIHTMDPTQPTVEAVAMAGGHIVSLGEAETVRPYVGKRTEILDLAGRTAIPGLTDAHVHFAAYGLSLQRVDLSGARSPVEAAERVRARAEKTPPGEWVRGRGWDRNIWSPAGFPRRQVLDAVAPAHLVAMSSKDGHALWVNTLALERLGMSGVATESWGAQVVRDAETGEATGVLLEEAAGSALDRIDRPGRQALRRAIGAAGERALRLGLTGVHDCEGGEEMAAYQELWHEQALPLRVYMLIPRDNLDAAAEVGLQTGFGDEWLRVGHLKLFADGPLGSRTADMLAPYVGEPGNRGIEVLGTDSLQQIVERASRARIAVATHAIGDRANRRVLDAYAETRGLWSAAGVRPRIEHVQLLARPDLPRLAEIGVIASMQPIHATSDWEMAEAYWGGRSDGAYAWRSLLDSGAVLAFGSDCPVETLDPLAGIHAAVTRQRPDGTPEGGWYAEQRLTVHEAVRAYTWGAAYAAGEEEHKGSLAVGKVGDLVVLSDDIFSMAPEGLLGTRVVATVCGGRLAYSSGI
jgi:predicted amidohydrolase YtcJ